VRSHLGLVGRFFRKQTGDGHVLESGDTEHLQDLVHGMRQHPLFFGNGDQTERKTKVDNGSVQRIDRLDLGQTGRLVRI
jgi:hypothetical protein